MASQAPATTQQGAPVAQSEISADINWWMAKLSDSAANSQNITNAPGDAPWSSGFFECFDPIDSCLLTCFCPCVMFGRTHHRLNKDPDLKGFSVVNGSVRQQVLHHVRDVFANGQTVPGLLPLFMLWPALRRDAPSAPRYPPAKQP